MQIGQCFIHLEKHIADIIRYSGRTIFRLGQYHNCIEIPNMDYVFMRMGLKGTQDESIFYGTCLPSACSAPTIQTIINDLFDRANFPLQVKYIQSGIADYSAPFTPSFFITFTVLVILFSFVIISTLSYKNEQKKILNEFCIQQTNKLFKYYEGSRLNVLNGIRSLSMLWVIYGHTMSMSIGYSLNIGTIEKNVLFDWKFLTVSSALYSVDTFFFVGGFILAYGFQKQKQKIKGNSKYGLAVLNRFLRLVPSYFLTIMIYYSIYPHLGSGPFWQQSIKISQLCQSIWRPLLFVDNLVDNGNNMCMGWGWYLQNDMQLFLYCIVVLFIYNKSKIAGYLAIFLSMAANFAYVMQHTYENQQKWLIHISDAAHSETYQLDIYYKPWSRCPPYLYGLLLGILYQQFLSYQSNLNKKSSQQSLSLKEKEQESMLKQIPFQIYIQQDQKKIPFLFKIKQNLTQYPNYRRLIQILGVAICLFISFIPRTAQGYANYWPQFVQTLYLTYGKLIFVIGISFIIMPSLLLPSITKKQGQQKFQHNNSHTLVRFILDTKLFNHMAKVSFCTYLIHLTLLLAYFNSTKTDFYYSLYQFFTIFVSFSLFSILCGTLLVYLVEAPFSKLQKKLLNKFIRNYQKQKVRSQEKEQKVGSNKKVNAI